MRRRTAGRGGRVGQGRRRPRVPGLPVAGDADDAPRPQHPPDLVVLGVGDEEAAAGQGRHGVRVVELRAPRGAAVAPATRPAVAGPGRDLTPRADAAGVAVVRVGDEERAAGQPRDVVGEVEPRPVGGSPSPPKAGRPVPATVRTCPSGSTRRTSLVRASAMSRLPSGRHESPRGRPSAARRAGPAVGCAAAGTAAAGDGEDRARRGRAAAGAAGAAGAAVSGAAAAVAAAAAATAARTLRGRKARGF